MKRAPARSTSKKDGRAKKAQKQQTVEAKTVESAKRKGSESSMLLTEVESFFRGDNTAKFNSLRVNDGHLINI